MLILCFPLTGCRHDACFLNLFGMYTTSRMCSELSEASCDAY